jgi:hypothetical protein
MAKPVEVPDSDEDEGDIVKPEIRGKFKGVFITKTVATSSRTLRARPTAVSAPSTIGDSEEVSHRIS